jgi:hypothetical protein
MAAGKWIVRKVVRGGKFVFIPMRLIDRDLLETPDNIEAYYPGFKSYENAKAMALRLEIVAQGKNEYINETEHEFPRQVWKMGWQRDDVIYFRAFRKKCNNRPNTEDNREYTGPRFVDPTLCETYVQKLNQVELEHYKGL